MNKTNGLLVVLILAVIASILFSPGSPQAATLFIPPATVTQSTGSASVSVTCGNLTEGSWTQLIAATSSISYYSILGIGNATNGMAAAADIATGGGGSETAIVRDLHYYNEADDGQLALNYGLPILIPSGSRVSIRCYGSTAGNITVFLTVFQ